MCYSVPALIFGSIVVVICPLISLMIDQVNFLRSKELNVTYINSSISQSEKDIIIHNVLSAPSPTLGPNVAAIICEIWRYWAILGDIRKNL